jgi:hypothetical protein
MSTPELYGGIGSLAVGVLFLAFPKAIGVAFCRLGQRSWKGHEDDAFGQIRKTFTIFSPDRIGKIYDEKAAPKKFRILGVALLVQAIVFFILSAVL